MRHVRQYGRRPGMPVMNETRTRFSRAGLFFIGKGGRSMKTEEYRQTCEEVLKEYHSDMNSGLTEDEAVKQRQKFGENKLQEAKKKSKTANTKSIIVRFPRNIPFLKP